MTFKMTLNDLEGQKSFSQNYIYNMNVKCTKLDVSMLTLFLWGGEGHQMPPPPVTFDF